MLEASRQNGILRLKHLREQTEAMDETMAIERKRYEKLQGATVEAVSSFNLFQTPADLAAKLVEKANISHACRTLEPSAGLGRIYRAIRSQSMGDVVLVEQSPDCCRVLYQETDSDSFVTLHNRDFLALGENSLGKFDRVVMNPPFKRGLDVKHIMHAADMLADGGRLVALCYDGASQNKRLKPICAQWEPLGPGLFKDSGTKAAVCMVTIDK